MDDLDFLHANLPEFEGYDDEEARHHTDQRVRAWVGGSLAACDRKLVELAQESCHVDEAGLGQILAEINQTFDRRSQQVPAPSA